MPLRRKVIQVGNSRAVSLPKSWLDFYEKKQGVTIKVVAIEVNHALKIEPIFPEKESQKAEENTH